MSSGECREVTELKSRLVKGYVGLAVAVVAVSAAFALSFFYMHHHDLGAHASDGLVILAFLAVLMVLFAVGLASAIRLALRFVKIHDELHKLTDDIAHDLRTPLTRMAAAAELAAGGECDRLDLAETVGNETAALLHLVNTMLDISRTGQGLERLPTERVDLAELARSVIDLYRPMAEDCRQTLDVSLPDSPVWFDGHAMKLRQMMQNLVDNAVKFTPAGRSVSVRLRQDGRGIAFTVSDRGCGVSPRSRCPSSG